MSGLTRWRQFSSGVRALLPLLLGVAPFGMIYGALALASGIPPLAAMAMSSIVFAGSAQFMLSQLVGAGAPALVMVASVGLINLRHALYSASMAPRMAHLPLRWKLLLSYLLTDEAYAAIVGHDGETANGAEYRHWFWFGAGFALWAGWQVATAAGVLLGAAIPGEWQLDFALPLTFIAIAVPMIRSRALLATALASGLAALVLNGWPHKLGMMAAALAGIAAGWALGGRKR